MEFLTEMELNIATHYAGYISAGRLDTWRIAKF